MSKLHKALDKAREQKNRGTTSVAFSPDQDRLARAYERASRDLTDQTASPVRSANRKAAREEGVNPSYTRTQVFTPDARILESNRIMTPSTDPRVKDYYDILRTQVLQRTIPNGWNSLMVTSAHPGEGKTLTSINLALAIARQVQQTALLVGANFRNPRLCSCFGLDEDRTGLGDYLLDSVQVHDILFSPGVDKMVILPPGKNMPATDMLGSPRMKNLVQELKTKYPDRYVIYDCPHVLDMPDSLVFSSYVDAVLMVVQAGKTPSQDVQEAVRTLEEQGVNIIGMVLNAVRQ
ncbi:polysaccharide biosynthesis tyrosine autokinase [Desulfonatronospira sp.]|uniref:polysaccharide biosynthesis tyrosine autokinase n=1 Tax=Desulfonatronospira sp. TaxID=1962951 RepID=UPI0025C3DE9D|nr:polysaccharide biosynthesis tyrosine autokinase [Desulfonatronospira sp.]